MKNRWQSSSVKNDLMANSIKSYKLGILMYIVDLEKSGIHSFKIFDKMIPKSYFFGVNSKTLFFASTLYPTRQFVWIESLNFFKALVDMYCHTWGHCKDSQKKNFKKDSIKSGNSHLLKIFILGESLQCLQVGK
jgi:hypothetical protein